jgi:predicted dienelactone hydrolase
MNSLTRSTARFLCVALSAVAILISLPISASAEYYEPDDYGPRRHLGYRQIVAIDTARGDREIPLDIWYPVDDEDWTGGGGQYPLFAGNGPSSALMKRDKDVSDVPGRSLIVFSHGFGGIALQSIDLMEQLASFGFIVVSPTHTGNEQGTANPSPTPQNDRLPDIKFIIDHMAAKNADVSDDFFGRINTGAVGVAGHSFGGMTAMMTATGFNGVSADPRVKAIMPIAASSSILSDAEISSISIPTLFMVGTLDGLISETARSHGLLSGKPDVFRVDVLRADHEHFANICKIGDWLISVGFAFEDWPSIGAGQLQPIYLEICTPPALPIGIALRIQNLYATSFFLHYLRGTAGYYGFLQEGYAQDHEAGLVFWGNEGPPIPALPLPIHYAALALGLALSGGFLIVKSRTRSGA